MMNYEIHSSQTGEVLIKSIELPQDNVENLSSDTAEGHFKAGELSELVDAGLGEQQSVYAIVL